MTAQNIESYSWEELNVFEVPMYPDYLVLITIADEVNVRLAVAIMAEKHLIGDMVTLEEVLRGMGFAAVVSGKTAKIIV